MICLLGAWDAPISHIEKHSLIPPDAHNECAVKASLMIMIRKNKFFGLPTEDPLKHLNLFEQLCNISKLFGVTEDGDILRLFPHSLGDKATLWYRNLRHRSTSWDACKKAFLTKFPSSTRNNDSEEMQRKYISAVNEKPAEKKQISFASWMEQYQVNDQYEGTSYDGVSTQMEETSYVQNYSYGSATVEIKRPINNLCTRVQSIETCQKNPLPLQQQQMHATFHAISVGNDQELSPRAENATFTRGQ
ncbi:hypothetical protein V5N11_001962 [Cardamine amara subsp. amara]|uniref:Retrotransposon gag domain-containing protein n=1 Tax=Cardamine amara subsp. amara TaxID=228776 RepID=A0ABD1AHL4_CARAN